jgi:perosamine synthetase
MSVSAFDRHDRKASDFEEYPELGFNFRMTDIQAAIGIVQLAKLDAMIGRRRLLAGVYREGLASIPGLAVPVDPPYGHTNYQSYTVVLSDDLPVDRNTLIELLHARGVSTRRGVMAAHQEPTFRDHPHGDLAVTERLATDSIILPLYHEMTEADVDYVVGAIADLAEND